MPKKMANKPRLRKSKGLPSPLAELIGGLKTNVITWRDKLSLIRGLLPLLLFGNEDYFRSQDHITYSDWHARHGITENALQRLWRPIALALNFIEPNVIFRPTDDYHFQLLRAQLRRRTLRLLQSQSKRLDD
jgi:uncharacterized protein with NAD-binding domain and iron-sulfur cluster